MEDKEASGRRLGRREFGGIVAGVAIPAIAGAQNGAAVRASQAQAAGGAAGVSQPSRAIPPPNAYSHALYKPVPLFAVKLEDDFWRPRVDRNVQNGWTDLQQKFESAGSIDAFRTIAEKRDAPPPRPNNDEFVYKWMEAGGFYSGTRTAAMRAGGSTANCAR